MQTSNWLELRPIPRNLRGESPANDFERGLNEWVELRSAELEWGSRMPSYAYYGSTFRQQQMFTEYDFQRSEEVRSQIRAGKLDKSRQWVKDANTPAYLALNWTAYRLGWRIVPLGRWLAAKLGDQSIAHDVEAACRQWVTWADAVWDGLVRLPNNLRNLESQASQVEPLLQRAREIEFLLAERRECYEFE